MPCARLSLPYHQLLSTRKYIVSHRMVFVTVKATISPGFKRCVQASIRASNITKATWRRFCSNCLNIVCNGKFVFFRFIFLCQQNSRGISEEVILADMPSLKGQPLADAINRLMKKVQKHILQI